MGIMLLDKPLPKLDQTECRVAGQHQELEADTEEDRSSGCSDMKWFWITAPQFSGASRHLHGSEKSNNLSGLMFRGGSGCGILDRCIMDG